MKKVEELCIKYLMNETDPDETANIRAEMIDDPDALIEYESMRATWNKVRELPEIEPPAFLTASILEQAAQNKQSSIIYKLAPYTKWMAAAGVAGLVSVGGWYSFTAFTATGSSAASASTAAPASQTSGDHWIDHNNILYIQPNSVAGAASPELYENVSKLKPVIPSAESANEQTDIRLTGASSPVNR